MRAVAYETFGGPLAVVEVPRPAPAPGGAVIEVAASGLCRSDWHGWMGHDPGIALPHVPGHEFAGVVAEVGPEVTGWRPGDRVCVPFVCACGRCACCLAGDQQVCERQTQPGFTHWGSFAEYVAVDAADVNLVGLDPALPFADAAALGCRFATAFRAVVDQGRAAAGEWVAVYGCGGVGLSAVMIAAAGGARVVAVDVSAPALAMAGDCGAEATVDAAGLAGPAEVAAAVGEVTGGGAQLSVDALGDPATCAAAILGLRRRGRHVQVGLLPPAAGPAVLPMDRVIGYELSLLGSHGMPAHAYPRMLALVARGVLRPGRLLAGTLPLEEVPAALPALDRPPVPGIRLVIPGTPGGPTA